MKKMHRACLEGVGSVVVPLGAEGVWLWGRCSSPDVAMNCFVHIIVSFLGIMFLECTQRSGWKGVNICVSLDVYCQNVFQKHWNKVQCPWPHIWGHQLLCSLLGCATFHNTGEQCSLEGLHELLPVTWWENYTCPLLHLQMLPLGTFLPIYLVRIS